MSCFDSCSSCSSSAPAAGGDGGGEGQAGLHVGAQRHHRGESTATRITYLKKYLFDLGSCPRGRGLQGRKEKRKFFLYFHPPPQPSLFSPPPFSPSQYFSGFLFEKMGKRGGRSKQWGRREGRKSARRSLVIFHNFFAFFWGEKKE